MKSLKLFIVSFCLLLAGCKSNQVTTIPVTGITTIEPSFLINIGQVHELNYTINPADATNKNVTITESAKAFDIIDGKVIGKSVGDGELVITTVDGGYSLVYNITVLDGFIDIFPSKDIIAYYDESNIDVVVPDYICASPEAYFNYSITKEGHFEVYITNTTIEEFNNYRNSLFNDSWHELNDIGSNKLQFMNTSAKVAIYDYLDYSAVTLSFFIDPVFDYNTSTIMNDIAITAWGEASPEMFTDPDINGVIQAIDSVIWDTEYPEDTPECLNTALIEFSIKAGFPSYIFRLAWPRYIPDEHCSNVYFGTSNWFYILHMYSFCEDNVVKIRFEAGPRAAFAEQIKNIV